MLGSPEERVKRPEVRFGEVEEVVWWCVVCVEWCLSWSEGEDERRRWNSEGLRAGVVVVGGGVGSRREEKSGILVSLGRIGRLEEKMEVVMLSLEGRLLNGGLNWRLMGDYTLTTDAVVYMHISHRGSDTAPYDIFPHLLLIRIHSALCLLAQKAGIPFSRYA